MIVVRKNAAIMTSTMIVVRKNAVIMTSTMIVARKNAAIMIFGIIAFGVIDSLLNGKCFDPYLSRYLFYLKENVRKSLRKMFVMCSNMLYRPFRKFYTLREFQPEKSISSTLRIRLFYIFL
jgi:hypothetical protein